MELFHRSCKQMACRTLAKQVPRIFRALLECEEGPRWGFPQARFSFFWEQQLKILMEAKKRCLCPCWKVTPQKSPQHFPAYFLSPVTWGFCLNRFGQQTVICPSKSRLISHPRKRQDFHVTYAVSWIINGYLMQDENSWHRWTLGT